MAAFDRKHHSAEVAVEWNAEKAKSLQGETRPAGAKEDGGFVWGNVDGEANGSVGAKGRGGNVAEL
eukprot:3607342-Prorocentrum_lima.AAC.1